MSAGRMEFLSTKLHYRVNFSFVLPYDWHPEDIKGNPHYNRPPKTLLLLHGYSGVDTDWLYKGVAHDLSLKYNLVIIMPTVANNFYIDRGYDGDQYGEFTGEELPAYVEKVFGVSKKKEDWLIGGLSMGGYGAIHTALAYPDRFSACIALSSALNTHQIAKIEPGFMDDTRSYGYFREVFGDLKQLEASDHNPEVQIRSLKAQGKALPRLYMAIGTEDDLYACNQDFKHFLEQEGVDFIYEDGPGIHDWNFWNIYMDRGLERILG